MDVFSLPNGLRENAETAIYVGDLLVDLPGKRKRYTSSRQEQEKDAHMCALVEKQQRAKLTKWENAKCTGRDGMC